MVEVRNHFQMIVACANGVDDCLQPVGVDVTGPTCYSCVIDVNVSLILTSCFATCFDWVFLTIHKSVSVHIVFAIVCCFDDVAKLVCIV